MLRIVVVDLQPCIQTYITTRELYDIFRAISLRDIVSALLNDQPMYLDILADTIKDNEVDDVFLESFYDFVYHDIINYITPYIAEIADDLVIKLLEWVDETSVVIACTDDDEELLPLTHIRPYTGSRVKDFPTDTPALRVSVPTRISTVHQPRDVKHSMDIYRDSVDKIEHMNDNHDIDEELRQRFGKIDANLRDGKELSPERRTQLLKMLEISKQVDKDYERYHQNQELEYEMSR